MFIQKRRAKTCMAFRIGIGENNMQRLKATGFTLIELLVVMTIISLLLTLAVPRYFHSVEKSKETVLRDNL